MQHVLLCAGYADPIILPEDCPLKTAPYNGAYIKYEGNLYRCVRTVINLDDFRVEIHVTAE